jgi:hypothetical protein
MTGFVDQFLDVRRQDALEAQLASRYRMDEAENRRVERLPAKSEPLEHLSYPRIWPSIDGIT